MARLYADENVPFPVVEELRRRRHDVLTALAAGNANRAVPDAEVLAFATGSERIVLTLNRRDFARLHAACDARHAGIVACSADVNFEKQAKAIDRAIRGVVDMRGRFLSIHRQPAE